ncbi:MAG: DUF433 domain-containing protein [Myxococcales bacterium]|nr:DUF433 domain-containing protein [Myxococcales bacterium]
MILDLLANGWGGDQILENYPGLEVDDIRACLDYVKQLLLQERPARRR